MPSGRTRHSSAGSTRPPCICREDNIQGPTQASRLVSRRKRSISDFAISFVRRASELFSSPRQMSRCTVFSLMPSIPAVSLTENARRGSFESPSGSCGPRASGGVSDIRLATRNCRINCSHSSWANVNIPVSVMVSGFFGLSFIQGDLGGIAREIHRNRRVPILLPDTLHMRGAAIVDRPPGRIGNGRSSGFFLLSAQGKLSINARWHQHA